MSLRFQTFGRAWHACVDDGHALAGVLELDDALWIATAAPVGGLRADPVFLAELDADKDGRIRADEVRTAIRWLLANLVDPGEVRAGNTTLRLSSLPPESHALLAAARLVLERTGTPEAEHVTLAAVRDIRAADLARGLAAARCVLPSDAVDADLASFLAHIVETTGGVPHPEQAVTTASMAQFLDEAHAWRRWHDRGALEGDRVLPLGSATAAAWALCRSLSAKLDQYFVLCDVVRLDGRLAAGVDPGCEDPFDVVAAAARLARAPLAAPRADGQLLLNDGVNPAYEAPLARLVDLVLAPLLGGRPDRLDRAAWTGVLARLAAHAAWLDERPVTRVGERGAAEVGAHVDDLALIARARALLAESDRVADRMERLQELEQLILYQAWLLPFVNSFVTGRDLYLPEARAMFEWGSLVLDGRWFKLAVKVPDAARHETFMRRGALCVMYVEVGDLDGTWDYEVAIPVTAGMRGFLVEGMWGVFLEHGGRERHARVRKLILHPISLRDAVFSPIRRLVEALQGVADKADVAQDTAELDKTLAATRAQFGAAPIPAPVAVPVPGAPPVARPTAATGVLAITAGAGIVLAAVSSALAYLVDRFVASASAIGAWIVALPVVDALPASTAQTVGMLAYPIAVVVILAGMLAVPVLTYLVPVCVAAWLKLRRRDLGSLLIGSGWAVNTRLFVTRDVTHLFTQEPTVPLSRRRR